MVRHFEELWVYQRGFEAAMEIFQLSRSWPGEEKFSLTDQVRRSSRSVCANIAEAWRKRRYPQHFISKLSDADSEVAETQNWIKFAHACGYITTEQHDQLYASYQQISSGLARMMKDANSWCNPA